MNKLVQDIYLLLPSFVKTCMVSLYGLKVRMERYGRKAVFYEELLQKSQKLDRHAMKKFQEEAFITIAKRAINEVPFYEEWARENGIKASDIVTVDSLNLFPVLTKDMIRRYPEKFVSKRFRSSNLITLSTSGSTGEPVKIYVDKDSRTFHYAFFTRLRKWNGVKKGDRRVTFLGRVVVKANKKRPPFWVYDVCQNNLIMSSFHMSDDRLIHYYEKIAAFQPKEIFGYASAIYQLAKFISDKCLDPISVALIMPTAETLLPYQREAIKKAFHGRLVNQYGCTEMAFFGAENSEYRMLMHPEHAITEILNDQGQFVEHGEGEVIATSLVNSAMPLIRYRVGDRAVKSEAIDPEYPGFELMESLEGRVDDIIYTKDGRPIARMSPIFRSDKCIEASQVIQEQDGSLNIYIVPTAEYTQSHRNLIRSEVLERVGQTLTVNIIEVRSIDKEPNGKVRPVKSLFNPTLRQLDQ